jgi:RNA polymerase sigma-70 factor (ECF subfamily)
MDIKPKVTKRNFGLFVQENGPRIYSFAVRLCENQAAGQALAKETLVQAYQDLPTMPAQESPIDWLYRICMTLWKIRKNRRNPDNPPSFWSRFLWNRRKVESDVAPAVDSTQKLWDAIINLDSEVQGVLPKLKEEDRVMLVLRDIADKPYSRISEYLNIPIGTVKTRLAQSRERLWEYLETHKKESF